MTAKLKINNEPDELHYELTLSEFVSVNFSSS